jgi:hypothetical protein
MMRLFAYILIALTMFGLLRYLDHPLVSYLQHIRTDVQTETRQSRLVQIDTKHSLIRVRLLTIAQQHPAITRLQVATIHDGIGVSGTAEIQFDIAAGVVRPPHSLGAFIVNQSLTQWTDYLSSLIAGHCEYLTVPQIKNKTARSRFDELAVKAFMVCPIMNSKHQLIGGLFASWDEGDKVPANITDIENSLMEGADAIAQILHNQG